LWCGCCDRLACYPAAANSTLLGRVAGEGNEPAGRVGSVIGALLLNASREQPLPGSSPGLATDPPKGGWRLLGWWRGTNATPSEIQSDDKSSHSKGGDNTLSHLVTPFHDLSPLAPEERRGEGTGVRGRERTGISPNG
jgi:hypothetical protein